MTPPVQGALARLLREASASTATLSWEDHRELTWFFRKRGIDGFRTSTCGAMLDSASLFLQRAVPCENCGGSKKKDLPGCGFIPSDGKAHKHALARLKLNARQRKQLELIDGQLEMPLGDSLCGACGGLGFIAAPIRRHKRVTARPTGSSVRTFVPERVAMSEITVVRLGRMMTRLQAVAERDPLHIDVLARAYAPRDPYGHPYALWALTHAGRELLGGDTDPSRAATALAKLVAAENRDSQPWRAELLERAQRQAKELLAAAVRAWNACTGAPEPTATAEVARLLAGIGL